MEPVRVALIGTGRAAGNHARALKKTKLLRLTTCHTRNVESGRKFAAENACDFEDTYDGVLKRSDVDAVILTTPNPTHVQLALLAAGAGKHALIEKPLANSIAECMKITAGFTKSGLTLSTCHDKRWTGYYRAMKKLIASGSVGQLLAAEANFSNPVGLMITPNKWRWRKSENPGGVLDTLGVHMFDTLRFLVDPVVEEVFGIFEKKVVSSEPEDIAICTLKFKNGAYATVTDVAAVPLVHFINVYGTEMNLFAGEKVGLRMQRKGSDEQENVAFEDVDPVQKEQEDFALSIKEHRKPEVDGHEGTMNVAVMEAAIMSSRERRFVRVDELIKI
jgi:predicted dehydrogenase